MSAALTPAAPRDASGGVGHLATVREQLADVWRFVVRPTFMAETMPPGRKAIGVLLTVFIAACMLDWLVWLGIAWWDARDGFLPALTRTYDTPGELAFKALLLAPVIEEALFRGWLSGRKAALRFAAFGFGAMACFIAGLGLQGAWQYASSVAGLLLAFTGLVVWLGRRKHEAQVPDWFIRHFRWLVWGSSLVFALIHLGNYGPMADPRAVLIVTSQLIGGLALAYVRTRLGLGAAILYHAAYNAIVMAAHLAGG